MFRIRRSLIIMLALVAWTGCNYGPPSSPAPPTVAVTPPPTPAPPPTTPVCAVPTIDPDRSLVVHDPALLATAFPLRKTMEHIIATSGSPTVSPESMLKTLLDSFGESIFFHRISGKNVPVDTRPQEQALLAASLLDPNSPEGMVPTGLFNRLDLAPTNGSNCGEYRIVYAKQNTSPGRFLLIFEAKLVNPNAGLGLAGCQPVAKFWADLSTETDASVRIAALEKFYYEGLPAAGFGAVVTHANYGLPLGQVRTNLFIEPRWMLREHRTTLAAGLPVFMADPVKESPLAEWYRVSSTLPPGHNATDQGAFRTHFLNGPACTLLLPDRANASATPFEIVNGIGAQFDPAGDDFQSVSDDLTDDPTDATDPAMSASITTRLTTLGVSTVDAAGLLNRAGAMTCAGCHKFSDGRPLGNGATWPNSAFFVHITEQGDLSDALNSFFVPRRAQILSRFVCNPTAEPGPAVPCPPVASAMAEMARAPLAMPTPPAVAANAVDAAVATRLRAGRNTASLRAVDDARLTNLAAGRQLREPAAASVEAKSRAAAADAALEAAVTRARAEEAALPGAFVPVRRTH